MTTVYVGCGLTHAPQTFIDAVAALKDELRAVGYEVTEFVGLEAGDRGQVYDADMRAVRQCDIFIAICDEPSTGLGMEIGRAVAAGTPTIVACHKDTRLSRQPDGASDREPHVYRFRYRQLTDLISHIPEYFAT